MYNFTKKILYRLVSKEQLLKHELFFRNIYSLLYSGNQNQCVICNKKLSRLIVTHTDDLLCPKCGSLSRDRRLWALLNEDYLKPGQTVLDFSPSRPIARRMKRIKDIKYISTDLSGNFIADHQYDITDLDLPSSSTDLIICYHILEHIDDDRKAMQELYRVMKPGATGLIQTPFKDGDIYENPDIITPADRELHFGQDDHVRIYSVGGLKSRLESAGFIVQAKKFEDDGYHGLTRDETVFIITKV